MQIGDITAVKEVVKEKMTKLLGLKSDADIEIKSAMKIGSIWSVVASVSKEDAKKKALDYIKKHNTSDIIELHSAIKCDINLLIEVIDELVKEGKIKS